MPYNGEMCMEKENRNGYVPQPIDTTGVELPAELTDLTEQIARNVHEVWAAGRMAEGWTYGESRNELLKQHPGLVPYNELPEREKEYDRHTAMETLRLIRKLGFEIYRRHEEI